MPRNNIQRKKRPAAASVKNSVRPAAPEVKKPDSPLLDRIEASLSPIMNKIFWTSMTIAFIVGLLLFDIRVSVSGDDSSYIIRAYDFIHYFSLPGTQGPLYPIILGPFIALFGINLVPLKFLSLLFILGFMGFLYIAFRNRIPHLLLAGMLLFVSLNSFILYYASQTYSEALFMFFQGLMFVGIFSILAESKTGIKFSKFIRTHLLLSLCILLMGLTRTIGFAAVFSIGAYFLLKGQWKNLFGFILTFSILLVGFEIFKFLLWGSSDLNFSRQFHSLFLKDYYNPVMGTESLKGFLHRLGFNSKIFLSSYLYTILGLHSAYEKIRLMPVLGATTWLLLAGAVILVSKKNQYLFFTGLYVVIFLFITFFIAHTTWGQTRFIIPYVPLIFLLLLSLLYYLLKPRYAKAFQWILPVFAIVLILLPLRNTVPDINAARSVTDKYDGLTPDMKNYCKLSEWVSTNLPKNSLVACRKPSISFIYGKGMRFFGLISIPLYPADSAFRQWKHHPKTYAFVPTASVSKAPVSEELFYAFKKSIAGYGVYKTGGSVLVQYYVMDFNSAAGEKTLSGLRAIKTVVVSEKDSLQQLMEREKSKMFIIFPDSLLNTLSRAGVTHVLEGSLRTVTDRKTDQTINTVERYMMYIGFKYPGIKTRIMQIGADDDEPATLYQLNYGDAKFQAAR
jgi:hypothetical protein